MNRAGRLDVPGPDRERRRELLREVAQTLARLGPAAGLGTIATTVHLSKGGLLHHFPDRPAMFRALAEEYRRRYEALVLDHRRQLAATGAQHACSRSHVLATFDPDMLPWRHVPVAVVVNGDERATEAVRQVRRRRLLDLIADGLPAATADLVAVSLDGTSFGALRPGLPFQPDHRPAPPDAAHLREALLAVLHENRENADRLDG